MSQAKIKITNEGPSEVLVVSHTTPTGFETPSGPILTPGETLEITINNYPGLIMKQVPGEERQEPVKVIVKQRLEMWLHE
jgi:hypothetical protein